MRGYYIRNTERGAVSGVGEDFVFKQGCIEKMVKASDGKGSSETPVQAVATGVPEMLREFQRAFTRASGLPLILSPARSSESSEANTGGNRFCEMLSRNGSSCAACASFQNKLAADATEELRSVECFAGLTETAVPLRSAGKVVAFLETGHVFLRKPGRGSFGPVSRRLAGWGMSRDLARAEAAWRATPVMGRERYDAFVQMVQVFARQLESAVSDGQASQVGDAASAPVRSARQFIMDHIAEDITLTRVAAAVNLSTHHLCRKFKRDTGVSFTTWVTSARVAKARLLLQNPNCRVGEAGYGAGFKSLSQYNRAFKKVVGCSPREYRNHTHGTAGDQDSCDAEREEIDDASRARRPLTRR